MERFYFSPEALCNHSFKRVSHQVGQAAISAIVLSNP